MQWFTARQVKIVLLKELSAAYLAFQEGIQV
jgi:hypothetical protein